MIHVQFWFSLCLRQGGNVSWPYTCMSLFLPLCSDFRVDSSIFSLKYLIPMKIGNDVSKMSVSSLNNMRLLFVLQNWKKKEENLLVPFPLCRIERKNKSLLCIIMIIFWCSCFNAPTPRTKCLSDGGKEDKGDSKLSISRQIERFRGPLWILGYENLFRSSIRNENRTHWGTMRGAVYCIKAVLTFLISNYYWHFSWQLIISTWFCIFLRLFISGNLNLKSLHHYRNDATSFQCASREVIPIHVFELKSKIWTFFKICFTNLNLILKRCLLFETGKTAKMKSQK